jgi:uncharacterized RDD family membrane protein YckC
MPRWAVQLAAEEQSLWVARVSDAGSELYRRGVSEGFQPQEPLRAPIAAMVASAGALYAFVDDGAFYSLTDAGWSRRRDLPERRRPLDLVGDESGVYALIISPAPGELPCAVDGVRPPNPQPFDPADAPFTVARHDSQGWIAIAACPPSLMPDGSVAPRLGVVRGVIWLLWRSADGRRIEHIRLEPDTGRWRPGPPTPPLPPVDQFWLTTVGRVPTLITATRKSDGGHDLSALRLLGGSEEGASAWRTAALYLSDVPAGTPAGHCQAAYGFNQHVALLISDPPATAYLRFGFVDKPPAEATVVLASLFARRGLPGQNLRWIQGATLLILFAVLLSLVLFRRGAMVAAAALPEGCLPALSLQRLVGWMVDLAPFAIAAALIVGADWQAGLRELLGWAAGGDAASGKSLHARTLLWWGLTCGGYTTYSLVMELLTQRTVGKVLTGTRLLSEGGTPPGPGQIVVRNLFRFLEMMPPLWILGFLVVLSRNRQRLGDIFARTVVIRRVRLDKTA